MTERKPGFYRVRTKDRYSLGLPVPGAWTVAEFSEFASGWMIMGDEDFFGEPHRDIAEIDESRIDMPDDEDAP